MNIKYIIILLGEPNSTFSEILGKFFKKNKNKRKKIIIIGSHELLKKQLKKLKLQFYLKKINTIEEAEFNNPNIIDINLKFKKAFGRISESSNEYINKCFKHALDLMRKDNKKFALINGPVSKKTFLKKKYLGITEYLSKKSKSKNEVMLIYNRELSVSPLTTHLPLKNVTKNISKEKIVNSAKKINNFYRNILKKSPKIAVLGLNPHCETINKISEEEKIIAPAINFLKKNKIRIYGPFSADTFFLKENIRKYDVVIGMYHDQVLTPIKTLYNFNAINITLGLPFIRISPDHGPNHKMLGKNISDPSSFIYAMKFLNKL